MKANDSGITMGLDQLNAMLAWWGIPNMSGSTTIEGQLKRLQTFASDLQKVYAEASGREMEALFLTNERIARAVQGLFQCRKPEEVAVAQSTILATVLDAASLQTRTWADAARKVQDCCAALALEAQAAVPGPSEQATAKQPPLVRRHLKEQHKQSADA